MSNLKPWMVVAIVFGIFFIACLASIGYAVGKYNTAVRLENTIVAQYEQNQNNLSQYTNKIMEMVQVPSMYKNDYKEVVMDALQGRYGKDGSKAMFQWLKEHNINYDSSLYTKIQDAIVVERDKFEFEQKKLIDRKRVYDNMLGTFPDGVFLRVFGFPTEKIANVKIVKSEQTSKIFESGIDKGLKLN